MTGATQWHPPAAPLVARGQATPARTGLAAVLAAAAADAAARARAVDAEAGGAVAAFYMHLWKCFFLCYALLPFAR